MAYASLHGAVKCHTSDPRLLQNKGGLEIVKNKKVAMVTEKSMRWKGLYGFEVRDPHVSE